MKSKNLEELPDLSKTKNIWLHFKVGNKLIFRDFWRWAQGDILAWLQMLVAILMIVIIFVAEAFLIANPWTMFLLVAVFVVFNLYISWKTYKLESR
jgi:hypothetical protein